MLCVLFKQWLVSVQAWRSRGKEVAACLHSWIVLWAPQCLMHFCSNIHKCADDPHWCWCSQLCLHPLPLLSVWMCVCEQSNSETLIATTLFPTVGVCCFNLEAWTIDKKYYKAQFITLRHKGTAVRRDTDRWSDRRRFIALTEVLSNKKPDIDIRGVVKLIVVWITCYDPMTNLSCSCHQSGKCIRGLAWSSRVCKPGFNKMDKCNYWADLERRKSI